MSTSSARPIRLKIEVLGPEKGNNFDRTIARIEQRATTSFDRIAKKSAEMGQSIVRAFDGGRDSMNRFAADLDKLNARLGLADARVASLGRNLRSLRMSSFASGNAAAALHAAGGPSLPRAQERLGSILRRARMRGTDLYEREHRTGVLAEQRRLYDRLHGDSIMLARLERIGATDALKGQGFDRALRQLGNQERGNSIRSRAYGWADVLGGPAFNRGGGGGGTGSIVTALGGGGGGGGGGRNSLALMGALAGKALEVGNAIRKWPGQIGHAAIGLSATIYAVERIGRGLANVFIDPVKHIIQATEASRAWEASVSGVVGGIARAREINEGLVRSVQKLPLTLREMRDISRQFTLIPSQAAKVASGSVTDANREFGDFAKLVTKLGVIDPSQGPEGALVSLREGLAGEFRSLRLRMEISPEQVAASIGKTVQDLQRDPEVFLKALDRYTDIYVGDEAVNRLGELYSKRFQKLLDVFSAAAEKVGNSGVFDEVNRMLLKGARSLFDWVDSPGFGGQAQRISDSLGGIIRNVGRTGVGFLRGLTGDPNVARGVGDGVAGFTEFMERVARQLPDAAEGFGKTLNGLSSRVYEASVEIARAVAKLRNPEQIGRDLAVGGARGLVLESSGAAVSLYGRIASELFGGKPVDFKDHRLTRWAAGMARGYQSASRPSVSLGGHDQLAILDAQIASEQDPFTQMALRQQRDALAAGVNFKMPAEMSRSDVDMSKLLALTDNTGVYANQVLAGFSDIPAIYDPATRSPVRQYTDASAKAVKALGLIQQMALPEQNLRQQIGLLRSQVAGDAEMERYVDHLAGVAKDMRAQRDAVPAQLELMLRNTNLGFAQSIAGLDPRAQAPLLRVLATGRSTAAVTADAELRRLTEGASGIDFAKAGPYGGSWEEGRGFDLQMYAALAGAIEARGGPGGTLGDRALRTQLLGVAGQSKSAAERRYMVAAGLDGDEGRIARAVASADIEQATARIRELKLALDDAGGAFRDFGSEARGSLEGGLGQGLASVIKRTGSFRDALEGIASDIIDSWSRMISRMAMQAMVGDFMQPQANGGMGVLGGVLGGAFGSLFGGGGAVTASAGRSASTAATTFTFGVPGLAEGGIVKGGRGGVLALVGEGRYDELVKPLPKGLAGETGLKSYTIIVDNRKEAETIQQRLAVDPSTVTQIVELARQRVAKDLRDGNGPAGKANKNRRYR